MFPAMRYLVTTRVEDAKGVSIILAPLMDLQVAPMGTATSAPTHVQIGALPLDCDLRTNDVVEVTVLRVSSATPPAA